MKSLRLRNLITVGFALLAAVTGRAGAQPRTAVTCDPAALVAAITAANATPEPDTLDLEPICVYTFTTASDTDAVFGDSALPRITTPITINGNGATLQRADGSPEFRLLFVQAASLTADNLTVSGGRTPKNGGGLFNSGGTVLLNNVTISDNTAYQSDNSSGWGGGIYNATGLLTAGSMTITGSVIADNTATLNGGGIYSGGPMVALNVLDSVITGNIVTGSLTLGNGNGGGIAAQGGLAGALTLSGNTFSNNTAVADGGGLYALINSSTPLINNIFTENSASHGGGIYVVGPMTIVNQTFIGNTAARGGGFSSAGSGFTVTISDSTFTGNSAQIGGGLSNGDGLIVTNSTFSGNSAAVDGGALENGARITLTDISLIDNTAGQDGGGLYNGSPNVVPVTNSTITGNTAGSGGGIYNSLGSLVVTHTHLADNTADDGGGVFNGDTITLTDSQLSGNTADRGGAVFNDGIAALTGSLVSGNTAGSGGGIFNSGAADLTNSELSGNLADLGGGIFNSNYTNLTGSLLSGNKARQGGGIYSVGSVLPPNVGVQNSTIAGNNAEEGGAAFNGSLMVSNSVIWGNSSGFRGPGPIKVKFSIVQEETLGMSNFHMDPLFVSPIPYASAPTSAGDYHLQPASPALDAGDNASIPADSTDLDGDSDVIEPLPFDRDGGARLVSDVVDLGAYETAQAAMPDDLLANSSFEVNLDGNKMPDGWTAKALSSDKLKCDPLKSHTGTCAFLFAGATGENAKLTQTVDISGLTFAAGDQLILSGFLKGHSALSGKLMLTVRYAGVAEPSKVKLKFKPGKGKRYAKLIAPTLVLTGGTVESVVVTLHHKSLMGKMWADTFRLFHITASARASTRGAVLPLPSLPAGMRGSN